MKELYFGRDRKSGYVIFSDGHVPYFPKAGHTRGLWKRKGKCLRNRLLKQARENNRAVRKIIPIIALLMASACVFTKPSDVDHFSRQEGWQEARYDGYAWFSCSNKEDWYRTAFVATKNGIPISGAICRGLFFKNATIRYN